MPDQDDGAFFVRAIEQDAQLLGHTRRLETAIAGLAPAKACAIVAADPRDLGDVGLNPAPFRGHASEGGFEDHHRRALAAAVDVQLVPAGVNKAPWPLVPVTLERGRDTLIRGACEDEKREDCDGCAERPPQAEEKQDHGSVCTEGHLSKQYSRRQDGLSRRLRDKSGPYAGDSQEHPHQLR